MVYEHALLSVKISKKYFVIIHCLLFNPNVRKNQNGQPMAHTLELYMYIWSLA